MCELVIEGLTVGYVLALSPFVMVWGLCWLYIRKSDREFDPLSRGAAERAGEVAREAGLLETVPGAADEPPPPAGRFQRETGEAAPR